MFYMLQSDLICHNRLLQLLGRRALVWGSGGMEIFQFIFLPFS
jgi:hypothetical protein